MPARVSSMKPMSAATEVLLMSWTTKPTVGGIEMRIAIPPTVGFLVQIVKGTSLAAIIGFVELTRAGQLMTNTTFKPMIVYPIVALLYFILCWPLSLLAQTLERRIDANLGVKGHF